MKKTQGGFALLVLIIGVLLVAFLAFALFYWKYLSEPSTTYVYDKNYYTSYLKDDIQNEADDMQDTTNLVIPQKLVPDLNIEEESPAQESPAQEPQGSKAYGEIKLLDFSCKSETLKKGTKLVTETGLMFELVKDENPSCINLFKESGTIASNDLEKWDDFRETLKRSNYRSASIITIKAIKSGKKYEVGEETLFKLENKDLNEYIGYAVSSFVGGDEGGMP